MAIIFQPKRRTFKPPVGTVLDTSHPLAQGLGACYPLGNWGGYDALGRSPLTNNGAGQAASQYGLASSFTRASSQYLSRTSTPGLALTGTDAGFTLFARLQLASKPADLMEPVTKRAGATTSIEYLLRWDNSSDRFVFAIDPGTGAFYNVTASNFGAPTIGQWHSVFCWRDPADDNMYISVDGGAANSASCPATQSGTNDLAIGRAGSANAFYWDGRIEAVYIYQRALPAAERSWLLAEPFGFFVAQAPRPRYWFAEAPAAKPFYFHRYVLSRRGA